MNVKDLFDTVANIAGAFSDPNAPAPRRAKPQAIKPISFSGGGSSPAGGFAPSCCIAKRAAMESGKLPKVRKP